MDLLSLNLTAMAPSILILFYYSTTTITTATAGGCCPWRWWRWYNCQFCSTIWYTSPHVRWRWSHGPLLEFDGYHQQFWSIILWQLSSTTAITGAAAHDDDGNDTIVNSVQRWWYTSTHFQWWWWHGPSHFEFNGHGAINSDFIRYSMTTITTTITGAAAHDDDGNNMNVNSVRQWWHTITITPILMSRAGP